jgi:hypothetical protein
MRKERITGKENADLNLKILFDRFLTVGQHLASHFNSINKNMNL